MMKKNSGIHHTIRLAGLVLALTFCSTSMSAERVVGSVYERQVTPATFKKFDTAQIKKIQAGLYEIYKDDAKYKGLYGESRKPLSDNVMGPITLQWMKQFCTDFKIEAGKNFADEAVAALLHFAEIAKAQPDWKKILLSSEFERWIDNQPQPQRTELYKIRRSGTAQQVISVLKLYRQSNQISSPGATEPSTKLKVYAYQLTEDDFKQLLMKQQILQKLAVLENQSFPNRKQFDDAVTAALKDITENTAQLMPMVEQYVEYNTGFTLSDHSFQRLKVDKFPDDILLALQPLTGLPYPNEAEFTTKVKSLTKVTDDQMEQLVQVADKANAYTLTESSIEDMAADPVNATMPGAIIEMLKKMQGVEYPDRGLFQKSALAKIEGGVGACPMDVSQYRKDKLPDLTIKDDLFKTLKGAIPDELFDKLDALRTRQTTCSKDELASVDPLIAKLYALYQQSIEEQATKAPPFDRNKPVQWDGGSCGCVLDQLAGTVYGFYPFWQVSDKPQKINFSVLSKIGYYGVSFDEQGELRQTNDLNGTQKDFLGGTGEEKNEFIRTARKFNSKFDWVIHRSDWQAWSTYGIPQKARIFDKLATNIVDLISVKLTDFASRSVPYMSLGGKGVSTQGDGVTLYFDGYPTDADSVAVFDEFVAKLKSKLKAAKNGESLNILLSQSAIGTSGKGIYDYDHLLKLIKMIDPVDENNPVDVKNSSKRFDNHILVLIEEPTTESKKKLRLEIEDALHGADRQRLLRKVVPVIEFDGSNWQQLEDDLIYFKDNFGGVGFWTLPIIDPAQPAGAVDASGKPDVCINAKAVDKCIVREYQEPMAKPVTTVCKFVCQNRWGFRLSWDVFLIMLFISVGLYFWGCRWRALMEKYWIAYLAGVVLPTVLLGIALLSCDPFMKKLSNGNWPLILLIFGVIGYSAWRYVERKSKGDMP